MAAPFSLEDLAKLNAFVEFVASNPAVLNMPQLAFFKKLIEQFGGVVPEGKFEMPTGAKCPFGGGVKSESKFTSDATEEEDEVHEMDAESEESEVELDMEADSSQPILELNVLYIEDKPPKIVKIRRSMKCPKPNKSPIQKNIISKTKKIEVNLNTAQVEHDLKEEKRNKLSRDVIKEEKSEKTNPNDPLFTPNKRAKKELCEEKRTQTEEQDEELEEVDEEEIYFDSDGDKDYCLESDEEYIQFDEKSSNSDYEEEIEIDDADDIDDEPLISLAKSSRSKMYKRKEKFPRLNTCLETCKFKCTTKYDRSQMIDMYEYYRHLNKDDKLNFIRNHLRKPVLTLIRNKKRGNKCYFLKHYKIGQEDASCGVSANDDDDLTKVCRKFFEGTLGVSDREIREAIEGYELKKEKFVPPRRYIIREEKRKLAQKAAQEAQEPQQYLDPETGTLTDTQPKKKAKRRKPGEPEPERFPKPINCDAHCTFKCHQNFSEEERKEICDFYWSLDFKRRKDFILSRMETAAVKAPLTPEYRKTVRPRAYQAKYYLKPNPNSENKRVCKHFMMSTLCVDRKFIKDALDFADKTTGFYTGTDRRRLSHPATNKIPDESRQAVLDHINSYPCWIPNKKSKTKYLHCSLSIIKMYMAYKEKCVAEERKFVSTRYYYKTFHENFNLLFLSNPKQKKSAGFFKANPNISHYTGDEVGGSWVDSEGNPLELNSFNPAQSLNLDGEVDGGLLEANPDITHYADEEGADIWIDSEGNILDIQSCKKQDLDSYVEVLEEEIDDS